MRNVSRIAVAVLAASLASCGDLGLIDWPMSLGPPARELPAGTVHFEPRSLALRVGETREVTLHLDRSLRSVVVRWWGSRPPVVTVADFACEPETSCGLVRFAPAEAATLQLLDPRSLRMRVTATATGQDAVVASVNTCVPALVLCDDRASDSLFVDVRP